MILNDVDKLKHLVCFMLENQILSLSMSGMFFIYKINNTADGVKISRSSKENQQVDNLIVTILGYRDIEINPEKETQEIR